jgi:hypothetical protein
MDEPMTAPAYEERPSLSTSATDEISILYLRWTPIIAGAIVTAALSSVFLSFGTGTGLAVVSSSATWRDTSSLVVLLGGLWLLLTSLASFGLGAYLAGVLRPTLAATTPHEVEFRDGVHGLLVWGVAILIGSALTFVIPRASAVRSDGAAPTASNAESLLAFELDRLFRSDQTPGAANTNNSELRAQAARIIASGVGRIGIMPDDRAYLVRAVMAQTGSDGAEAENRVAKAFVDSNTAISKARHSAVILAFMIGASLLIGAAVAWLAAAAGGRHRDGSIWHEFWRRWEVDRLFFIR